MRNTDDRLNLRFFSSEKLLLITSNKVASRYVSGFFENSSSLHYGTLISVDPDFNIMSVDVQTHYDAFYKFDKFKAISKTKEEWESFLNKKNKKDVIFLYRDPYERTLSGIIQEFLITIEELKHSFVTKLYIQQFYNSNELYSKFRNSSMFGLGDKSAETELYKLYEDFLIKYIEFESSDLIKKHHIKPYLIYLYDFITNSNIDLNKIHLVNIDNSNINLKELLTKYELEPNKKMSDDGSRGSNSKFKSILKTITEDRELLNSNLELSKSIEYFYMIADIENSFFKKMQELPQNIK